MYTESRASATWRALACLRPCSLRGMATEDVLGGWREQYDRMRRTFHRFLDTYGPAVDAIGSRRGLGSVSRPELDMQDAFIHFVQDAWHLKDWLKNDPATSLSKTIEREIGEGGYLRMCQHLGRCHQASGCEGKRESERHRARPVPKVRVAGYIQGSGTRPSPVRQGRS